MSIGILETAYLRRLRHTAQGRFIGAVPPGSRFEPEAASVPFSLFPF